ncbi:Ssl1-like-domain-containing protein [Blyttiomyces helicus]|uniref:General transcription and DNA repair factor IIH n=1 Tax=Blyttiomyces helicus TaxID=388810 RepID=A0A4P9WJV7_9FUNG|nr:Ssl1-like-domain-containing protein [Blyttiomyces helicus]|eukprot:RKO93064.1 Ssl1-like-domain-containing protein [Blyttiomyces helicus]
MDADDEGHNLTGVNGGYTWEEEYKRSWDVLQEDDSGSLLTVVQSFAHQKRRRLHQRDASTIQRGIIRHVYLIIDLSRAMAELDLKPSRLECSLGLAETFVGEYFEQNPLGQLGVVVTRDGLAEKLTELSGNPNDHIDAIRKKENREPRSEPSLQNALDLARASLHHVPSHGSREIIVLFGSLTTCDPGDIMSTVKALKKDDIRVSIVGLSAEVQICKTVCEATKVYSVVLNESHYKDVLFEHLPPPPIATAKSTSNLIQMGFPVGKAFEALVPCVCHQKSVRRGYLCPRCSSIVCDIPMDCPVCTLTLVSSPLLARSYHHLFPVETYKEVPTNSTGPGAALGAAVGAAADSGTGRYACGKCGEHFCLECDLYVHDVLHNCPGCCCRASEPRGKE